jgi:hypothetical protein
MPGFESSAAIIEASAPGRNWARLSPSPRLAANPLQAPPWRSKRAIACLVQTLLPGVSQDVAGLLTACAFWFRLRAWLCQYLAKDGDVPDRG